MPLQSQPSDPLEAYSGLSLFPRTFASFPNPLPPHDSADLQLSHDFLRSMPVQSPNKLLEQAKAIVDNSSELLKLEVSNSDAEHMEHPRERRPALGRKRSRFFLKDNSSQPTVNLEPSLDMDKLTDPEEFFLAFERAENAKREIEKQTGTVLKDLDQNNQSMFARPRRPGLLRRSVKYKHCYSTAFSPLESFEEEIPSPACNLQPENSDPNVELEEKELSVANVENKVSELLDHLLTSTCDGDDTVNLLQERFQIKPLDLENICLPDLQDIRKIDLKDSRESLAKPRNSLSDLQSFMKGFSKRTQKQNPETSVNQLASPIPPRSPLTSISLLKKLLLQSDVLTDPFSTDDANRSPVRNASGIECNSKQSDQVITEKGLSVSDNNDRQTPQQQPESSILKLVSPTPPRNPFASISLQQKQLLQSDPEFNAFSTDNIDQSPRGNASPIESVNKQSSQADEMNLDMSHLVRSPLLEANQIATANASSELNGGDFAGFFDKFVNDNARRFDSGINASSGSQTYLENNSLRRPETESDSRTIQPNEFGRVEDIPLEAVVSSQIQVNVEGSTIDNSGAIQRESDEYNAAIDEDHSMNGFLKAAESAEQLHENKKAKIQPQPCNKHKGKAHYRRQSLAGSGTTFDDEGRRRSTRIRSRPLEFWKGERFLYGRVHSSLATVIGIKYESPGKGDGLKVKSFVSDEYKELIEQAAR
ncbi:Centromere protein C, putative isoform 2 [Hibiscus syriacus]|uniref:Centromere protein C, putative isoform 2 n=1 Tax=Hibiscus syriacus TaxID=106335 RepID=A0A6A3AQE0_HIBSY|nr:centromere protein C-like isoform X2 [Hibiscus syriacus]KAE8705129.1 Centromere protein C, putative isoform 2 [Hibiscus syriacus]